MYEVPTIRPGTYALSSVNTGRLAGTYLYGAYQAALYCICANILLALLPTRIGSVEPHALKATARRTESTLPESFPSSR